MILIKFKKFNRNTKTIKKSIATKLGNAALKNNIMHKIQYDFKKSSIKYSS